MAKKNESLGKTVGVVLALLVCSIVVSGAAIGLKPMQEKNAALDMQKNVLMLPVFWKPIPTLLKLTSNASIPWLSALKI